MRHSTRLAHTLQPCLLALAIGLVGCTRDVTLATRGQPAAGSSTPLATAGQAGSVPVVTPVIARPVTADAGLRVRIEDIRQLEISLVTLACAGDCVEVAAVASGGNPPYNFVWDDGSLDAQRRVCLAMDSTLRVAVSDSPLQSAEFTYEPQTASVELNAHVLACTPPAGDFCVKNPSLEGTASVGLGTPDSVPPGWVVCDNTPDVNPYLAELAPTDGKTYLGICTFADATESAGGEFCAPLSAGQPVAFKVDLAVTTSYALGPARLELWGGLTPCGKDELLWTSQTVQNGMPWMTQCGVLQPSRSYPYLRLLPNALGSPTTYLVIDHLRAVPGCD